MAQARNLQPSHSRIVQVPMDAALVADLDAWADKLGRSRSDLIREACRRQVKKLDLDEADRLYRERYEKFPEDPSLAESLGLALGDVLPDEEW